mmetsp:Transcript_8917/g.26610  ORF Transcript_8917/g.26610 Transcript_8917/m.26610 type:complete len:216 (+) Transcript_8917:1341-1988(+)
MSRTPVPRLSKRSNMPVIFRSCLQLSGANTALCPTSMNSSKDSVDESSSKPCGSNVSNTPAYIKACRNNLTGNASVPSALQHTKKLRSNSPRKPSGKGGSTTSSAVKSETGWYMWKASRTWAACIPYTRRNNSSGICSSSKASASVASDANVLAEALFAPLPMSAKIFAAWSVRCTRACWPDNSEDRLAFGNTPLVTVKQVLLDDEVDDFLPLLP